MSGNPTCGPRQGGKAIGGAGGGANNEQGRMEVDVKLATFATPGARGKAGQGDAEREFSTLVLRALEGLDAALGGSDREALRALEGAVIAETFPKTSVDVYATVGVFLFVALGWIGFTSAPPHSSM